ncbi:MAG: helix-turn-helix domain-containing protein [Planctomycetota bacterium]
MVRHQLRGMLERAGISERQLSERSGVSRQVVRDILNGETLKPRPETTRKLARELGVPVTEFREKLDSLNAPKKARRKS